MYLRFAVIAFVAVATIVYLTQSTGPIAMPTVASSAAGRGNAAPFVSTTPRKGAAPAAEAAPAERTLLERAQAGEARAQFRLGDRMRECYGLLKLDALGYVSADAEACKAEDVPTGDWKGWRDKAVAARDPLALLYAAVETRDPAQFEEAAAVAARSHDPEAQIALGHLLLTTKDADPIDGAAWLLVACPDCTLEDPRLGFAPCVEAGHCASNTPLAEYLASEYGPEVALEAQARAESLKAMYGVKP